MYEKLFEVDLMLQTSCNFHNRFLHAILAVQCGKRLIKIRYPPSLKLATA